MNYYRQKTTKYFKPERGVQQEDPISTYLSKLILNIFCIFVKNKPKVDGQSLYMNFYTLLMHTTLFSFSKIENL